MERKVTGRYLLSDLYSYSMKWYSNSKISMPRPFRADRLECGIHKHEPGLLRLKNGGRLPALLEQRDIECRFFHSGVQIDQQLSVTSPIDQERFWGKS